MSDNQGTLKAEANRMVRLVDASHSALVITDAEDSLLPIVYCNDSFVELTGYDRQEVIGRNCNFLQGKDSSTKTIEIIRKALSANTETRVIIRNYRKDGTEFWNDLIIMPISFDGHRYFIGSQMIIDDPSAI